MNSSTYKAKKKLRSNRGESDDGLEVKIGYMCKTDFDHELGHADDGNRVYPSAQSLKKYRGCIGECGYVKVSITLTKVMKKSQF